MCLELVLAVLLEKQDRAIKQHNKEETGEVIGNKTNNQVVEPTEVNQTCVEVIDITIIDKEDKEGARKLEIMLLKTFLKWEQQTTLMVITRIIQIY